MHKFFPKPEQEGFPLNNKVKLSNSGHMMVTCASEQESMHLKQMFLFYKRTQSYEGGEIDINIELSQGNHTVLVLGGDNKTILEMLTGLNLIDIDKAKTFKETHIKAETLKNEISTFFANLTDNTDKAMLKEEFKQLLQQIATNESQEIDKPTSQILTAE